MSSPIASLKKNKKVPLSGSEKLSRAPYKKTQNVTDILQARINDNTNKTRSQNISRDLSQVPTDMELLSSMAGRLSQTELQLRQTTKELIDKDRKISILEDKVKLLEKARGYSCDVVKDLEEKCRSLQQQVYDMEEFLADYGMVWVGVDDTAGLATHTSETTITDESSDIWNPSSSLPSNSQFKMDFNLVVRNIEELNAFSGSHSTIISPTKAGATLKPRDLVPLTLYANGILMFSGPFRPYSEETTQRCMQDIMDGYFPSELQQKYPDGVPFKLIDKREVTYQDRRTELLFPGSGQSLHDTTTHQQQQQQQQQQNPTSKIYSMTEMKEFQEPKIPVETFLRNLPSSVIKNGKIIDVRSGISETLKGSNNGSEEDKVIVIDTDVIKEIKSRVKSGNERSGNRVTTLRIKSELGDHTYILKLRFTDSIGDVRTHINKIRPELNDNYSLKTSFPNHVYDNKEMTLEEAELVPNAILHILLRK